MSAEVVAGLLDRRAKPAGDIELKQIELRRLIADLDSLDAAVRVFQARPRYGDATGCFSAASVVPIRLQAGRYRRVEQALQVILSLFG